MLGKNLFKVESKVDISIDRYRSLIFFYNPLIGNDAHYLYEFLVLKGSRFSFEELNKLLNSLNMSIDAFEENINKLNEYRLVKTLKKKDEDEYIFVLNNPLGTKEFVKDDLFVRDFILKTSGQYYQSLISEMRFFDNHQGYEDVSARFNPKELDNWSPEEESFLKPKDNKQIYNINTMFDINVFLKDISDNLFPIRFRSYENLSEIATLADIYNISYDKMRYLISEVYKTGDTGLDLKLLRYKCQNAIPDYKYVENAVYDIPCLLFLMNKQDGKEATPFDKKLLYNLAHDYKLKPPVINVLIEHALRNCNNSLLENYINPIASDLHRNNIETAEEAIKRLDRYERRPKEEVIEKYDDSNNIEFDEERKKRLEERRAHHDK